MSPEAPSALNPPSALAAARSIPLLGFLLLPLVWSLPEALVSAELSSSLPHNAGYVLWTSPAFGPFPGFLQGLLKWTSGTIDNALYPVLFLDYIHPLAAFRVPLIAVTTAALTYLDYYGLHIVGISSILIAAFSLSPFIIIPSIRPRRWFVLDWNRIHWQDYFNCMFCNLNYWDKASTVAGEMEDPRRNFSRALFVALGLVVASYLVSLLAGTGVMGSDKTGEWTNGYFAVVAGVVGGPWLALWVQAAMALSMVGLFAAEMSGDSFQLLGMADLGMLREFLLQGYMLASVLQ